MAARRNYRKQADKWFSLWIRHRDGKCRDCGSTDYLQCAHLVSRRYKNIRTSASNAVALCRGCHMKFTHRPLEWEQWIIDEFGCEHYDALKRQALDHDLAKQVDWSCEAAYWKQLCVEEGLV